MDSRGIDGRYSLNWLTNRDILLLELDASPACKWLSGEAKAVSESRLKSCCRGSLNVTDIRNSWFRANDAIKFHSAHPTLLDSLYSGKCDVGQGNSGGALFGERVHSYLSMDELEATSQILSVIQEQYQHIAGNPFINDLVPTLLLFFTRYEAFSIITGIADRVKSKSNRPYLISSREFREWSVRQLTRYVPSPTSEQLETFRCIVFGSKSTLPMPLLIRMVGCFLVEGCKVFVRFGIAWIMCDGRAETDTIVKKAFRLRISLSTYPLREKTRRRILKYMGSSETEASEWVLKLGISSTITNLSETAQSVADSLSIPQSILLGTTAACVHSSLSDGLSPVTFFTKLNAHSDSHLTLLLFQSERGCIAVGSSSDPPMCTFILDTVHHGPYALARDSPIIHKSDGMLFIQSTSAQVIMGIDKDFARVSFPGVSVDDFQFSNVEIYTFS